MMDTVLYTVEPLYSGGRYWDRSAMLFWSVLIKEVVTQNPLSFHARLNRALIGERLDPINFLVWSEGTQCTCTIVNLILTSSIVNNSTILIKSKQ